VKLTREIKLTPEELAEAFCEMDDDSQAKFFVECARIERSWDRAGSFMYVDQWREVGKHLRECACSTEDAREMVRRLADGITP
jgi:hypothetical protein